MYRGGSGIRPKKVRKMPSGRYRYKNLLFQHLPCFQVVSRKNRWDTPFEGGGIAPPLRMLSKGEMLRKGGRGIAPNWPCWDAKNPIARNRGGIAEIVSRHRAIQGHEGHFSSLPPMLNPSKQANFIFFVVSLSLIRSLRNDNKISRQ